MKTATNEVYAAPKFLSIYMTANLVIGSAVLCTDGKTYQHTYQNSELLHIPESNQVHSLPPVG